jgi:hypothetical protein
MVLMKQMKVYGIRLLTNIHMQNKMLKVTNNSYKKINKVVKHLRIITRTVAKVF